VKLKVRQQKLSAGGKAIAVLNEETAAELGIRALDKVVITAGSKCLTAIVNTTDKYIRTDEIGLFTDLYECLNAKQVDVNPVSGLLSTRYIKEKVNGKVLNRVQIKEIIKDIVEKNLSEVEISSFITALDIRGMSLNEAAYISEAMVETGSRLKLGKRRIFDKHSIGGISGDKASPLVVAMVAANGLIIPKTSSRAITSPAGTADRMEVLCPVNLTLKETEKVVLKTNGCLVWGGSVELTPADDLIIQVEYPLSLDPLMLPSIMSKKKAVGATNVVIDIPIGPGSKILTKTAANSLSTKFKSLGRRLGIQVDCVYTKGFEPLGQGIGPALAAREILQLITGKHYNYQVEKSVKLANVLLRRGGKGNIALKTLRSGKAEIKFREIIEAQGGDPDIGPDDITVGDKTFKAESRVSGRVSMVIDDTIAMIARKAGSPKDKEAGVFLWKKTGDYVKRGDPIMTIYSIKNHKLEQAIDEYKRGRPFVIKTKGGFRRG